MSRVVLLVGDGNHQFVRYLAKYLNLCNGISVHLLSFTHVKEEASFFDKIHYFGGGKGASKISAMLSTFKLCMFFFRYSKSFDVISFQFIRPVYYYLFKLKILRGKHNTVASVWGTDVLSNNINRKKVSYIFEHAKQLTCATAKVKSEMLNLLKGHGKISLIKYGLEPLENIKKLADTQNLCKANLGIDNSKLVVTLGHNASKNNQHIKCIEEIDAGLTSEDLKNIIFIIPLTYGRDEKYVGLIKKAIEKSELNVVLFEEFMTDNQVANLRKATDIYINVQQTDMLSGAMQEHIYAGNIVITGSWLGYEELKDIGVNLIEIDAFAQLPSKIKENINVRLETKSNVEAIYELSSWKNTINGWLDVFFK